jgi:hydroxyacylglutathione hydrolase
MDIYRLPVRTDNYIFILHNPADGTAAVVDPADAPPVLAKLQALGARLVAILNTHHHNDHVGGNRELIQHFPEAQVYASEADRGRIPMQTKELKEGDRISILNRTADIWFVPGHTSGHIAYYFAPDPAATGGNSDHPGELFCGDTLFAGGCGRLFEGTAAQMQQSLAKLRALPESTRIWCAHEYTLSNLRFAVSIDGDNAALQDRLAAVTTARAVNEPTIPTTLAVEKATNPFLRWDSEALQAIAPSSDPATVLGHMRKLKDRF